MRRPRIDFQRCAYCGTHVPREADTCPYCGRHTRSVIDLFRGWRAMYTAAPALFVSLFVFALPDHAFSPSLTSGEQSALEAGVFGVGLLPLLSAMVRMWWRRRRSEPGALTSRIEKLRGEHNILRRDLRATQTRIASAERERAAAQGRASTALLRELEQDRRLRTAQRRMIGDLSERMEQLEIEGWRLDLQYFEACRDARLDAPEVVAELAAKIDALEKSQARETRSIAWQRAIEDATVLHRELARGVPRWLAATRLDPLTHAQLVAPDAQEDTHEAVALKDDTESQLERIDRGFSALEELSSEIRDLSSSAQVRVSVDEVDEENDFEAAVQAIPTGESRR